MPNVVLRHPKLKGQPIVLDVPHGGAISASYKAGGWEIDSSTTPDDARAELADTSAKAVEKAASRKFTPGFEQDPADVPVPDLTPPAEPASTTQKEN